LGGALASNRSVFGIQVPVPDVRPCEVHKGRIVPGPKGGSFREDQGLFHGYLWMVGLNSPTDIGAYRSEVVPASPGTGSSASQSQQCGQLQSTEQKTRLETVSLLTKRPHRLSHLGDFLSTSHAHFGTVEINILVFIACHVSSANPPTIAKSTLSSVTQGLHSLFSSFLHPVPASGTRHFLLSMT
jgi:hypothetical protein